MSTPASGAQLPRWLPAALLGAFAAAWAVDALLGTGVFWAHDLRHHHMPWRVWAAGEWGAGRLPLWAPAVGSGFPLMADGQAGVLYPPTMLLFALLPAPVALNWSVLLHHLWAAAGALLLGRALGLRRSAALVGAVAFGFSGFLASHTVYLGMQNAVAWLPWALWGVVGRRFGVAGLSVFMLCVAGHPQAAAFSLLLVGAIALWRREILPFTAAAFLGLVAASPQLLATVELSGLGLRDGGVDALFSNIGALPPQELLNGAFPHLFGFDTPADVQETYFHRGEGYWGQGLNHWEMSFFLGVPAIVLSLLSLASPEGRRRGAVWWALALLSLLLMLGATTPLWPLFRSLPGLSGFRFPVRFALVLTTCVAVLAATGVQVVLAMPAARLRRAAQAVAGVAGAMLVAFSLAAVVVHTGEAPLREGLTNHFMAQVDPPPEPPVIAEHPLREVLFPGPEPEDPTAIPGKVQHILDDLRASTTPWSPRVLWPLGMLLGVAGILALRDRMGAARAGLALAALLYADLWRFGAGYNGRSDPAFVESRPAVLAAMTPAPDRAADDAFPVRTTVVDRRIHPSLDVQILTSSLGLLHGTRDVILTSPLLVLRTEVLLWAAGLDVGDKGPEKWERLLDRPELARLLGLRWLTSVHRVADDRLAAAGLRHAGTFAEDLEHGPVQLYEVLAPRPPAWLAPCAVEAAASAVDADPVAFLDHADPVRPLLERFGVGADAAVVPACTGREADTIGTVRLVDETPTRMVFEVDAPRDALLVQRDTWYPGWEATLDGEAVPLHRAAFAFRGVAVPAGSHTLTLRYAPASLSTLLWVSPAALLTLLLWSLLGWRARGRGRGRSGHRGAGASRS